MEDRLTIAIPVYNRSTYIREALESALNQTVPVPILVVDNASTQFDFEALVKSYHDARIRYVRNEKNVGMAGNWNRCIDLCNTPYLALVHDDDKLESDYVVKVLPLLEKNPAVVFCRCGLIDEKSGRIGEVTLEEFKSCRDIRFWCAANYFYTGIAFNVEVTRRLGNFRLGLPFTPDFDLWFRLALEGPFVFVDDLVGFYRQYHSIDRATSNLYEKFETTPRLFIQFRRNISRYEAKFPNQPRIPRPRAGIKFYELIHLWGRLPRRRALYVLAVFVKGRTSSRLGRCVRWSMGQVGIPICSILAPYFNRKNFSA